jgi:hypothetical protein
MVMRKGKVALIGFSMMICALWLSPVSQVAYAQPYDNATVLKTQEELKALGYDPGPLDGIWGRKTKRALKKFQYERGLTVTGKIDRLTKESLGLIKPDKAVTEPIVAKEVTKPGAPKDTPEPIASEEPAEPIATKAAEEPSVPITTVQNGLQDALRADWNIKSVQIKNGVLTIVPHSDVVTKDGYAAMIPTICEEISKYPHAFHKLKEIRVLNASENQGWSLLAPKQCARIANASPTHLNKVIFRQSADILIFTSGRR